MNVIVPLTTTSSCQHTICTTTGNVIDCVCTYNEFTGWILLGVVIGLVLVFYSLIRSFNR